MHHNCIPLNRSEECMHQFPAGHIQECLHCCEGLTVQLDPWALNYSRQKQEEKRITRKLCEHTQKFFHSSEAFPVWPLWKGNQVNMAREMLKCHALPAESIGMINVKFWSPPPPPQPPLCLVCTQVSSHPFILCWLGLDRLNFCGTEE